MNAVIWDVDGTLVDTAELHFQAWLDFAREMGKPFTRADFAATFGWRNAEILPKLFGPGFSEDQLAEMGERKEVLYRQEARKGLELLPGVRSLLEGLKAAGFHQAIGSSAPRANLDLLQEVTATAPFFGAVVGSEDTQRGKPAPDVFLIAAERLGVAPGRCLVLEDAPAGVQAARAAGMKCIGVTFVGHHSDTLLRQSGADRVVRSLEEVSPQNVMDLLKS